MKIAIMQPYIFPYLGYFQLIACVDKFILFDDVNFIKKGWINRNRILVNGNDYVFTIPLEKASQNKLINQIQIANDNVWKLKFLKTITENYSRAPFFNKVIELIQAIIFSRENNLSKYIFKSLEIILQYLEIGTEITFSSDIHSSAKLKGQQRIINICLQEKADIYINSSGGRALYSKEQFLNNNIQLFFLEPELVTYAQGSLTFQPNRSIIDIMMWNPVETIRGFLEKYKLS